MVESVGEIWLYFGFKLNFTVLSDYMFEENPLVLNVLSKNVTTKFRAKLI